MEFFVTYHKNIESIKDLGNELSEVIFSDDFNIQIEPVSAGTLVLRQDTIQVQKDSVALQPTFAQIRYWRWLRERKLLIGDSRYIQPKSNVKLTSTVKVEGGRLGLPNREINYISTDWITILLLLVTILLASVRIAYSKYIGNLFQSLVNYSTSFRMFREKNYTILHGAFRLDIIFYLTFSLFLFQVLNFFQLELIHNKLTYYAASLGTVIAYFLVKKISYRVLGSIFKGTSETNEYLFNMDNINRSLGLILFPVAALINYYPANNPVFMVFVGIFTVAVFYVFLVQRGISILLRKQFSIFYLFLYLCVLEFVPLILIYKVVVL
ncbi:MAG: DUF4271 domain-containing protein [Bacteroidetes bacterium]|nr:DUF4271 domain-containing protein [Bacteroidota bacterium]